jgi:hypothetical protein
VSRSQVDLSAPPAIAEEPEPTTPLKGVPEEKAIPDTAVAEAEEAVLPPKDSVPGEFDRFSSPVATWLWRALVVKFN